MFFEDIAPTPEIGRTDRTAWLGRQDSNLRISGNGRVMENAGRNIRHLARTRFLDGDPRGRPVRDGGTRAPCCRELCPWAGHRRDQSRCPPLNAVNAGDPS